MSYEIIVNYDTGDSFNSYPGLETSMDFTWENLDMAKESLRRMKEHYKMAVELDNSRGYLDNSRGYRNNGKSYDEIIEENSNKPWFVPKNSYLADPSYSFYIVDDDGNNIQTSSSSYTGYFETLNFAEIRTVSGTDDDMKFYG